MKHDDDPQYIARALICALDPVDEITAKDLALKKAKHPVVVELIEHHGIENYRRKLGSLTIMKGEKRQSPDEHEKSGAKRQKMENGD